MAKKIISKAYSFKGFDWVTFLLGCKKPVVMLLGLGISTLVQYPDIASIVAALGGSALIVERIWALAEFYIKQIKA